jgi:hypothetical protein
MSLGGRGINVVRCAALVVVLLGTSGCGGGGGNGRSDVESVVQAYLRALADGNGTEACDQLTGDAGREAVEYVSARLPDAGVTSCSDALENIAGGLGGDEKAILRDAKITEATIEGDNATVTVEGGTDPASLTKVKGQWFISGGLFESVDESAASTSPQEPDSQEPSSEEPSVGVGGAAAGETAEETADRVLSQFPELGYLKAAAVEDAIAIKVKVGTTRAQAEELCNYASGALAGKGVSTIVVLSERQASEGDLAQCTA